ncbi:hypothetical protein ACE193_19330 [Bernardetia sp. OM2101]|uniref:hypothetical protein n=1 Tax=Bernardetia sp. OM2101 TaxID=3344876 RepID=UPI0035CFCD5B
MKNNSNSFKFYFTSAFLWLGVAFFAYFIYQNSDEQEIKTIVESSTKIDDLHQEFYDLEYTWWERNKLARFVSINKRDVETVHNLENSKQAIKTFKKSDKITFLEIEKQLPVLGEGAYYNGRSYEYWIDGFVENEKFYLAFESINKLYKNILFQIIREEWNRERDYKIYEGCILFVDSEVRLNKFENHKIALYINSVFNNYTIGYFSFPKNAQHGVFNENNKAFEFEMTTKILGRNPKTITKKYRTLPKEGQKLKPFDYEEIK